MMVCKATLFCVFALVVNGVCGVDSGEVKTVSVMEGDSVTLHTDLTELQRRDQILWQFGPQETRIAEIIKQANFSSIYDDDDDGRFRDRLKLDYQTGSLIITNIRFTDSGVYKLQIISNRASYKRFSVTVYAPLPIPVITSPSAQNHSERSSSSRCVLVCSVMNVTRVTLSWYKEHSLISSISASDLNIRLSLPLEVEYQDTNTYSCVLNNPIRNQTQHLHITDVCGSCSDSSCKNKQDGKLVGIVLAVVFIVLAIVIYIFYKKHKRTKRKDVHAVENAQGEEGQILYADTTFSERNKQEKKIGETETIYSSVIM